MDLKTILQTHLQKIYKEQYKEQYLEELQKLLDKWSTASWKQKKILSEKNIYLITYGDSIYESGVPTLKTLHKFIKNIFGNIITDIHLLPMFEYSSDDGFSVIDYRKIDPTLGRWDDLKELSKDYCLMYDFVVNHVSQYSKWFKGYLNGDLKYQEYFIEETPTFDTSQIVRPRTSPLFSIFQTKNGEKKIWTTFSDDQIDLNVKHFPVLLEMVDILLMYAYNGATAIRLDAIGFLWKKSGTSCVHLEETHEIIKMWRTIINKFQPNLQIITETNSPHKENISYFGNGDDEAHQVYQFTLPPLVLYSFTTHNNIKLIEWAKTISTIGSTSTFFNFLSSHDGIGVRSVEGILSQDEIQILVDKAFDNGGCVNYKSNIDGTRSPYELNINYQDALLNKDEDTSTELQIAKILAAHAILLSFIGVPAIYYHSLLGSRNYYKGVEESGINRRINREKLEYNILKESLNTDLRRKSIFEGMKKIIHIRQAHSAFNPYAIQEILELNDSRVFGLKRISKDETIVFVVNLSAENIVLSTKIEGEDLVTEQVFSQILKPYQFIWVKV